MRVDQNQESNEKLSNHHEKMPCFRQRYCCLILRLPNLVILKFNPSARRATQQFLTSAPNKQSSVLLKTGTDFIRLNMPIA